MNYISTRGQSPELTFSEAVLSGLARDGGLLLPDKMPSLSEKIDSLKEASFQEIAVEIFKSFANEEIPEETLKQVVKKSYSQFRNEEVAPVKFFENFTLLELFHGPTFAFKDVALQFLGNIFEELLKNRGEKLNIVGATSGDTGSAAIHGIRGKANISIYMLHPKGRVSHVQERQMTTVLDENVFNIGIDGSFDDAQRIVKSLFGDLEFRDSYNLGAVNSINWARIMAQITYYFYSAFRFWERYPGAPLNFSVPTGNFGDIYAGYLAKQLGLPVNKLIIATNENNILVRAVETGIYEVGDVQKTISPSMDIQVASNFERYLFNLFDRDSGKVREKMLELKETGKFSFSEEEREKAAMDFKGITVNKDLTLETIKKVSEQGEILDPHTAIGVAAGEEYFQETGEQVICLATAHFAKFPEAIQLAVEELPESPREISDLEHMETKSMYSPAEEEEIKRIIRSTNN